MQYYYEIEEAWKLYVEQGVVKAESLNPSLLRMWELSKIAGAKYNRRSLSLTAAQGFQSKHSFSLDLEHYSYTNYLSLYLIDETNYVHDVCGLGLANMNIPIGARLNIENIGYTAFHLSRENGKPHFLNYSENYMKALQSYETYAQPIDLGGERYYILVLSQKMGLKERLGEEFSSLLDELKFLTKKVDDLEAYKKRDFLHLFELSTEGSILNRLANTNLNKFFDEGVDLTQTFHMLNMYGLLKGEKQFISSKSEGSRIFLLSPIKWNSASSILCQVEELESSYRAFYELGHYGTKALNFEAVPVEVERRLKALSLSSYPSLVYYRRERDLSFIMPLVDSYREEEKRIISYESERELVNELCLSREKRSLHRHDLEAVAYHIIVGEIEKSCVDELGLLVREAIKAKERPYSLLFYIKDGLGLASKLEGEASILEMQTMDFSSGILSTWIDNYYRTVSTSPDSAEEETGDLLALRKDLKLGTNITKLEFCKDKSHDKPLRAFSMRDVERQALIDALTASNYNISEASRILGISRASLYRKMKNFSIYSPK